MCTVMKQVLFYDSDTVKQRALFYDRHALLYNRYYRKTGTVIQRVLSYNGYCHTTGTVLQRVLLYNGYCPTTATGIAVLMPLIRFLCALATSRVH